MDSSGSNKRFRHNLSEHLSTSDIEASLGQLGSERSEEKIQRLEAENRNLKSKLQYFSRVNQKNFGPKFTLDILALLYVREGTVTEKILKLEELVLALTTLDGKLDRHIVNARKEKEVTPDPWRRLKLIPENSFPLPPPPLSFPLAAAQSVSNSDLKEGVTPGTTLVKLEKQLLLDEERGHLLEWRDWCGPVVYKDTESL